MPKPMYVWSGSAWVSVATEVESLAGYATQSYADNTPGVKLVVPTSVAVGSGSGSVGTSGAVTFSGASSVSLNSCFTSTYTNYKVLIEATGSTTNQTLLMRMRASGTDLSSAVYNFDLIYMTIASSTVNGGNGSSQNQINAGDVKNTGRILASYEFSNPQLTEYTNFVGSMAGPADYLRLATTGYVANTTSYDGLTIYPTTGTMTGNIRVYGMKN